MIDVTTCSSIKSNLISLIDYVHRHTPNGGSSFTHSSATATIEYPSGLDEVTFASSNGHDFDCNIININPRNTLKPMQLQLLKIT